MLTIAKFTRYLSLVGSCSALDIRSIVKERRTP